MVYNGNPAQSGTEKQGQADVDVVKPEHCRLNVTTKIRHDRWVKIHDQLVGVGERRD